ncbi:MAG TPA: fibronectin type III domain-containing protein [Fimbriimonadaceae bacterium]|nr:fibronectin type III domain-containing protein [Fimbriimonadaceae bacterium]
MPWITEIVADGQLNGALANFATVCDNNAGPLGLTGPMVAEIEGAATNFSAELAASTAAKAARAAAVQSKSTQKTTSKAIVSKYAKIFRANSAVSDELLAQLMLPPHSTPGSESSPTTPLDLTASANGEGVTTLKWNRNGNIRGTIFQIEKRTSPSGAWSILDTTTRRTFVTASAPGQYVAYRVRATRSGQSSAPSTPVVLWDGSGSNAQTLEIAA